LELLSAGQPSDAEWVYREDLKLNPGNPRSLYGLALALRNQGKAQEAAAMEEQFKTGWRYADTQPPTFETAPFAIP
jgi:hypothetical protein